MSESVTKGNTSFRCRMNFSIAAASDLSAVDAQSITSDIWSTILKREPKSCRSVFCEYAVLSVVQRKKLQQ